MSRTLSLHALATSLVFALGATACGDSTECSTNADCPTGRVCRLGLCALDPGFDGNVDALPDIPLDCLVAGPNDLIITEILADPPSGADIDGNGTASATGDEFVEVVNVAARPVALTNVQLDVAGKRVGLGAICLNPYQARVLFGSAGLPGLTNSGSTVALIVDGSVVQSHTYGTEGNRDSSLTLSRQLDKESAWVLHKDVAPTAYSPGTCSNGNPFPDCEGTGPTPDADVIGDGGEIIRPTCTTAPQPGDLVVNELLADPGDLDANGDGAPSASDDEFIELVNVSANTVSLDGLVYRDAGTKVFNFPAGLCLAPNQALILFGKHEGTGDFGDAIVLSGGNISLNNDADTVTFRDAGGTVIAQASYSGNLANADQSIVREVDLSPDAAFVRHALAPNSGGARMSPGRCQNGNAFPDCAGTVITPDADVTQSDTATDTEVIRPTCTTAPQPGDLVVNELLADPGDLDANGDGASSASDDEFIELVNVSANTVSLDGLVYRDAGTKVFNFPAGLCLAPNQALILFGKHEGTGDFGDAIVLSGNNISLNNDADTVTFRDAGGTVIAQASYSGNLANADQSIVREVDLSPDAAFVRHALAPNSGGARMSPGRCQNGNAFPDCVSPVEPGPDVSPDTSPETIDDTSPDTIADTTEVVDDVGPSCGPAPVTGDLVINEVMAMPGSTDWNGDGTGGTPFDDEYVEIISTASGPVQLQGLKLADFARDRYTFGALCLEPGEAIVVFGVGTKHFRASGVVQVDTARHVLELNNTVPSGEPAGPGVADQVILRYGPDDVLAQVSVGASTAGISWSRVPDVTGAIVAHPALPSSLRGSPGQCVDGEALPLCLPD